MSRSTSICTDSIVVPEELQANVLVSTVDKVYNWSPQIQHVAPGIWFSLLRHRDDRHSVQPL